MAYLLQQLANTVPIASLYAALAFGYAIAFAVTRRADITYGAIFVFAGHLHLLGAHFGWESLRLVLPAAISLGAILALGGGLMTGAIVSRYVLLRLVRASANALIVATLGILLVLMEGARLASGSRELWLSPFLNQPVSLSLGQGGGVTLTVIQLANAAIMLAAVALGHLILSRHRAGRIWRAVADDPFAAELLGVNSHRVFVLAYSAAAFYASLSGVLATSYYGTMDFGAGLLFGLKVVLIAAAGGHSHPLRSALGAAVVGLGETLWSGYGPILWRDFAVVSTLVFVLVLSRRKRVLP
ncbi:branched-chain amino acid transport system permease protein [Rhizobium sp. NFR07]|uniref:branched-chain amino acid ABC transporter permease n=1 Tax=Rhizobium sp. NFR07 TaxID=1566262 RepID=UPI0008EA96CC|nr:branched-chain amino acid ABC transporter permease [Rhizobium sp. NFR07]SFB49867.1 branched-chain amino acid transport system permease protein [Rhizobium sp. NFR07]